MKITILLLTIWLVLLFVAIGLLVKSGDPIVIIPVIVCIVGSWQEAFYLVKEFHDV